ncbi:cysteine desulfurase [Paenibacillus sp. CGMCC 1.16610]|uniref:cysteine desulfurase n=1 Tax=Paenibacillus anseongense TaxID=2682845 RepID=A0ABW9U7S6_9BACL|nr:MULTISPECIES: cysteine desulfurase family protein [Paenibacillus]MBA2939245.1 cysteine desulfurase [Paenibacillus sp. CGMCC 1.16610]MVQ35204.1 aminotransferase class V-fold PLP-dependent enzyme [Paenibacillus anseongense]
MNPIYLDHAATTPVHPDVMEAMLPFYTAYFGNPSSTHSFGRATRTALNRFRDAMAKSLCCLPGELIFTSGGTESNNMAIFGIIHANNNGKKHIITTEIEHHAVLHPCERLESLGYEVTYLPVGPTGLIQVEDVESAIRPDTALISIMYVNNEIGTIQPIAEVGRLARSRNIPFHVDAVQALGKLPLNLHELPVDLLSLSAHKIYGPNGVGALYVSKNTKLVPHVFGGAQERKRRAGTENVAAIAGFAKAMEMILPKTETLYEQAAELRQCMIASLEQQIGRDQFTINGHAEQQVPHILNISFPGVSTETLLMNLDLEDVAAASGSACTSGSLEVSHVLQAMKLPENVTASAVRFSFGMGNSKDQIETAAQKIATIVKRLRNN